MEKLRALKFDTKILIIAFASLGAISLVASLLKSSPPPSSPEEAHASLDTFIPKGYALVPVEIANADSLSSLIGDVGGVVDLYLAGNDKQKGNRKVASRVKLARAPLNPQQYTVLVRESESPKLLSLTGPFVAVVQNPHSQMGEIGTTTKSTVRIDYQN
ncbi:MAG TPA: hypothetical protein VN132_10070 [Bdellovibrio sp.]|nr:hypothetical protein [Bdellovibrio sp.]